MAIQMPRPFEHFGGPVLWVNTARCLRVAANRQDTSRLEARLLIHGVF
jgi:hypothetical protein